jgi:hypothetical protein
MPQTATPGRHFLRHDGICRTDVFTSCKPGPAYRVPVGSGPGHRARRKKTRPLIVATSSDRLFLDRVACQHCPSPLHRHGQTNTHLLQPQPKPDISTLQSLGHFYFALTGGTPNLSPPRENVLLVPNRNVLLTESRWEGERSGSSDHDPAGTRPFGGAEEGTEEADHAAGGGRGTGDHHTACAAAAEETEEGRRQSRDTRLAKPGVQSPFKSRNARESGADPVAGGLPGLRADAGERVPEQKARHQDGARSVAADHDRRRVVVLPPAEGGQASSSGASAAVAAANWCSGTRRITTGWKGAARGCI